MQPGVKDEFLNVFYHNFIKTLVERLKRKKGPKSTSNGNSGDGTEDSKKEDKKGEGEDKKEEKEVKEEKKEEEEKKGEETKQEEKQSTQKETHSDREHRYGRADLSAGFVQTNVCELLSYCIRHHGYRIKYFLLGGNAVQKVLKLLNHKDSFLVLGLFLFFPFIYFYLLLL